MIKKSYDILYRLINDINYEKNLVKEIKMNSIHIFLDINARLEDKGHELCLLLYDNPNFNLKNLSKELKLSLKNTKLLFQKILAYFEANNQIQLIFNMCSTTSQMPSSKYLTFSENKYIRDLIRSSSIPLKLRKKIEIENIILKKLNVFDIYTAIKVILNEQNMLKNKELIILNNNNLSLDYTSLEKLIEENEDFISKSIV